MLSSRKLSRLILEALQQEEPIETAWLLTDAGVGAVPIQAAATANPEYEKSPIYKSPYTSSNPMTRKNEWGDFLDIYTNDRYGVAIEPLWGSGLMIIDADTPEEVKALEQWWESITGEKLPPATVATPGVQDEHGEWKHQSGGHWYLTYEHRRHADDWEKSDVPKNIDIECGDSKFNVRLHGCYCLCPPTVRSTGRYKLVGDVYDTSGNGIERAIFDKLEERRAKKMSFSSSFDGSFLENSGFNHSDENTPLSQRILQWQTRASFLSILLNLGRFTPEDISTCSPECFAAKYDSSAQGKSVVVHSDGCGKSAPGTVTIFSETLAHDLSLHGDTIESGQTISLWSLYRDLKYNGDLDACIRGEGLHQELKKNSTTSLASSRKEQRSNLSERLGGHTGGDNSLSLARQQRRQSLNRLLSV